MGHLASYSLISSIYLLTGYLIYKWLLATRNQPGLNRLVLLLLYALSFAMPFLPAVHVAVSVPAHIVAEQPQVTMISDTLPRADFPWQKILLWVYVCGVGVVLLCTVVSLARLMTVVHRGQRLDSGEGYTVVITDDCNFAPFSWVRYIVLGSSDYSDSARLILMHESAHLRLCHWIDLLFAHLVCALQWYNPASWLMRRELANVHEYQADNAVISQVNDVREYQMLLIKKAVGRRFAYPANSLNHSKLKKRITMMCTKQEGVRGRLRALAVAPAMLAAMFVVNLDAVASIQTKASHVSLSLMSESAYENTAENETVAAAHNDSDSKVNKTISENATPAKEDNAPEVLPSFPGGEDAFYRYMILNMKYPQEAVDANEQGKVVVNFTITSKGEVTDPKIIQSVSPSLDAEALRIVNSMPLWNPGTVDGKPVNCTYTCPINFRLAPARNKTK